MSIFALMFTITLLAIFSYWLGRKRSFAVVQGEAWKLHSLPSYYGFYTAIWCGIPALFVLAIWMFFETSIITHLVVAGLPEDIRNLGPDRINLVVNDIINLVSGNIVSRDVDPAMQAAADHYIHLQDISRAILGALLSMRAIRREKRARNSVENIVKIFLIASSTIAIFTTIGIVLSVLFEAIRFFETVPLTSFLFGLQWSPQMAIREDQVGSSGAFGWLRFLSG